MYIYIGLISYQGKVILFYTNIDIKCGWKREVSKQKQIGPKIIIAFYYII